MVAATHDPADHMLHCRWPAPSSLVDLVDSHNMQHATQASPDRICMVCTALLHLHDPEAGAYASGPLQYLHAGMRAAYPASEKQH